MILTLTPNPARDTTYRVGSLMPGVSHRVAPPVERAGGKGINTAAALTAMGVPCLAIAPVGRSDVADFDADLSVRGIAHHLIATGAATRRSVAVVDDDHTATLFNETGIPLPETAWDAVSAAVARLGAHGSVLTVSGSLPPDAPPAVVSRLVTTARSAGMCVILDVSGPALSGALDAGPDLVKPNREEAAATLGRGDSADVPALDLAGALVDAGARAAVISDGAAGLCLATTGLRLRARLPRPLRGNPTGAGDALTAALAAGLDATLGATPGAAEWARLLRRGVAWSAAAVLQPVAGEIDPADVARLLPTVEIEEITA